jgi:TPR repeat protein
VPKDHVEAARWVRKAAEQGSARAQNNLGSLYVTGEGVPKDYVSALMWFNLAAAQGYENGQEKRDIVAKRMTPDQIAEAQRMAREWMAKHQR